MCVYIYFILIFMDVTIGINSIAKQLEVFLMSVLCILL